MRIVCTAGLLMTIAGHSFGQGQQPIEGGRQLYYFGATSQDSLPPVRRVPAMAIAKKHQNAANPAVMHLGLRYHLLLFGDDKRATPVNAEEVFRNGDCLPLELESNHSAYLYVMNKQSDGNWSPMLPSPRMPEEVNVLNPGQKLRAPKGYCFNVEDPPGTETLIVILSRDPRDFMQLYAAIKQSTPEPSRFEPGSPSAPNPARLNSAVETMAGQFGTHHLPIGRAGRGATPKEAQHAVYVVNASNRPSSTLVARIEIRHL